MRKVKNIIISKISQEKSFIFVPVSIKTPQSTSKTQIDIASNNAASLSQGIPNTSKYSISLYEKPNGSLAFTKPETIKRAPTKIRQMVVNILILQNLLKLSKIKILIENFYQYLWFFPLTICGE